MDEPADSETIDLVRSRLDFLAYLDGEPREKPTMVEDLGYSRSTIDRAIRSLQEAGLVAFVDGSHVTTLSGRLVRERYEAFLESATEILDARPVLNALPNEAALPSATVAAADVRTGDTDDLIEALTECLEESDRIQAMVPPMADPSRLQVVRESANDLGGRVLVDSDVVERVRQQFPLLSGDIADDDRLDLLESSIPEFGLVFVSAAVDEASEPVETLYVLAYEEDELSGWLRTRDQVALEWARERFETAAAAATDPVEKLRGGAAAARSSEQSRLPVTLRSQGFDRIDEQYFENRGAVDPTTAWRAGLKLPEVAAGYDVERTVGNEDGRKSIADVILSSLDAGEDVALLGPPGSGKSTVCRQVAYEWFDSQRGPVLYRESGQGQPFEDTGALEQFLEAADGHALVVVEDAVRAEANRVFETMQSFSGREDVSFLLDARNGEWRDPDELPVDARLEAFRQEDVETVRMPPLDDHDRAAIVDRFDSVVDATPSDSDEQLDGVVEDQPDTDAGAIFLLFHRLSRYADPLAGENRMTTLDEHVDGVRARLADAGETILDVGVLANALNAAGIGVYPEYLHALAAAGDLDHAAVREAIAVLDGEVLFGEVDGEGPFRTVHDAWSVRFLDRLLDAEDDETAAERFGKGITALLALADDPDRREAVANAVGRSGACLAEIEREPTRWADDTARQVFDLGESYPKLEGLYGAGGQSTIVLPEASRQETEFYGCVKRGRMYVNGTNAERARTEFEHVVDQLTDPRTDSSVDEASGRLYAQALEGLNLVSHSTDEQEAIRYGREAIEVYEAVEENRGFVLMSIKLSSYLAITGDTEAAIEYIERALSIAQTEGDSELTAMAYFGHGQLLGRMGKYKEGIEVLKQSSRLSKQANSSRIEVFAYRELTNLSRSSGDLSRSLRYGREWLQLARENGYMTEQIASHLALMMCKLDRANLQDAQEHLEKGEKHLDKGNIVQEINYHWEGGVLARLQRDYKTALERLWSAIELAQENDIQYALGIAQIHLAWTLLETGEIDAAIEHAETAIELGEEIEIPQLTGYAHAVRGLIALEADSPDRAEEHFEAAIDHCEAEIPSTAAMGRRGLGDVARERGEHDSAREYYERALETFRETGRIRFALEVVEDLADLTGDRAQWLGLGAEIAEATDLPERAEAFRERARGPSA